MKSEKYIAVPLSVLLFGAVSCKEEVSGIHQNDGVVYYTRPQGRNQNSGYIWIEVKNREGGWDVIKYSGPKKEIEAMKGKFEAGYDIEAKGKRQNDPYKKKPFVNSKRPASRPTATVDANSVKAYQTWAIGHIKDLKATKFKTGNFGELSFKLKDENGSYDLEYHGNYGTIARKAKALKRAQRKELKVYAPFDEFGAGAISVDP